MQVIAPYDAEDARGLLKSSIRDPDPVVFLENEILYGESFKVRGRTGCRRMFQTGDGAETGGGVHGAGPPPWHAPPQQNCMGRHAIRVRGCSLHRNRAANQSQRAHSMQPLEDPTVGFGSAASGQPFHGFCS